MDEEPKESEGLHKTLIEKFPKLYDKRKRDQEKGKIIEKDYELDHLFSQTFDQLYKQSTQENFYWQYCTSEVYENHYNSRYKSFLESYPDATEMDFIKEEFEYIISNHQESTVEKDPFTGVIHILSPDLYYLETFFLYDKIVLDELLVGKSLKKIAFSQKRKLEFLEKKIKHFEVEEWASLSKNNHDDNSNEPLLDDLSKIKHPERFVMLNELGIIDYLQHKIPTDISERKFATLLSSFTGIHAENLRKMINGSKNQDHNNKLTSDNINSVHSILIKLNLKPEYFKKKKD